MSGLDDCSCVASLLYFCINRDCSLTGDSSARESRNNQNDAHWVLLYWKCSLMVVSPVLRRSKLVQLHIQDVESSLVFVIWYAV